MKRYNIKCKAGSTEYIDILKETDQELFVRFTRDNNGNVRTTEETITKNLFDICVKTGYLFPTEAVA